MASRHNPLLLSFGPRQMMSRIRSRSLVVMPLPSLRPAGTAVQQPFAEPVRRIIDFIRRTGADRIY
jgi:hypothetical protein